MSKLLSTKKQQLDHSPRSIIRWLDPYIFGFILLATTDTVFSSIESANWLSNLLFLPAIILAVIIVLVLSRKLETLPIEIPRPYFEGGIMLGWYGIFMLFSTLTRGEGILSNEFSKWLWFIILPTLIIFILRRRSGNLKSVLQSFGLRRQNLGKALLISLAAYAVMVPFLPFLIPESSWLKLQELFQEPLKVLIILPIGFLLSLVTAASTEEVFFRGILQSRLTKVMRSEVQGCLIAAFLFGIYHLPYAYFSTSWPSHGNILWAVSSVLAEQMVAGLILGVLWSRTRNIAAPVLFHALVNTVIITTSFTLKIGQ